MVVAAVFAGCYDYDKIVVSGDPVRVKMSYTFSSSVAGNRTRQPDVVVQNTNKLYPGIGSLRIIPMRDMTPTVPELTLEEPVEKDDPTSYFYHSSFCDLEQGVNGCLVYGAVDYDSSLSLVDVGSLIAQKPDENDQTKFEPIDMATEPISTQQNLSDISFSLEPMWDNRDRGTPAKAVTVAGYLTAVANVFVTVGSNDLYWKNSKNEVLKGLFINFTNHENNLPGSEVAVKKWLEILVDAVDYYLDPSTRPVSIQANEVEILNAIKSKANDQIDKINSTGKTNYPRNINLPDGAAVLRWVRSTTEGDKFQPRMNNTNLDNINGVFRFAYPARLYYFVGSELKTSNNVVNSYTTNFAGIESDASVTAWDKVLEEFETDNGSVTSSTKSVALKKPVQYAVAQLQVTVKAATETLQDAKTPTANDVNTTNNAESSGYSFPLKGIIIGGQRPVDYRFQPVNSDVDTKFIYDSQVKPDCYLTTTQTAACNTLVLQSYRGEDVLIILEFENNSSTDFEGVNGTVYRGTRFYLIGKVNALTEEQMDSSKEETKQVFTKDYITTVKMTVSSLAKAYSVLPSLLNNNLEIGIEATPQWVAATPTVQRLE